MDSESGPFALVGALTVVGLLVMLYGVYLTSGEHLNTPMTVGGGLLLAAVGVLTAWMLRLEPPEESSGGH